MCPPSLEMKGQMSSARVSIKMSRWHRQSSSHTRKSMPQHATTAIKSRLGPFSQITVFVKYGDPAPCQRCQPLGHASQGTPCHSLFEGSSNSIEQPPGSE